MKFAFSMNAFRQYDVQESLATLGQIGYDGVEILLDRPHLFPGNATADEVDRVTNWLTEYDLGVSNCNAFMLSAIERSDESNAAEYSRDTEDFHHPSFIEPDPEDRRSRIEHTKTSLRTAASLGADHISITPGGPRPKSTPRQEALDLFVDGIRAVAETSESVGVDVLVEPEPELLIANSDEFLEFMDRIDSPSVGCNFDAGHFYCVDEDPAALVEDLAQYTGHYHLEDIPSDRSHEHTQLGEGGMNIDGFLEAVESSGYEGFVTVELYPYEETPAETARAAYEYLEEHDWI